MSVSAASLSLLRKTYRGTANHTRPSSDVEDTLCTGDNTPLVYFFFTSSFSSIKALTLSMIHAVKGQTAGSQVSQLPVP